MYMLYKQSLPSVNGDLGEEGAKASAQRDLAKGVFHGEGRFVLVEDTSDGLRFVAAYDVKRERHEVVGDYYVEPVSIVEPERV